MPNSHCENCKTDFYYDENINVKFYETVVNNVGFQLSGDFPTCPNCEAKCRTESAINYDKNTIKYTRLAIQNKL